MNHRRPRAFSLVEITISMGILMFVLLAAMSLVATSMTVQRNSIEFSLARAALNKRIAAFRAQLHSAPLDQKERPTQFRTVLEAIAGAPLGVDPALNYVPYTNPPVVTGMVGPKEYHLDLIDKGPKLPVSLGGSASDPRQAHISVWAYTQEARAEAECGLTDLDLNADGIFNEADPYPGTWSQPANAGQGGNLAEHLHALPLRLEITWIPGTATNPGDVQTLTAVAVIY